MINFKKTHIVYIVIVLVILLLAFRQWFFSGTILTNGDWYYYTLNSLKSFRLEYFNVWLGDQNFGRIIVDVAQAPTYALYGVFASLGLNYAVGERIIHMLPSVLGAPISAYFFLRLFSKNIYAIAAGTAVYCCNTYFLQLLTGDITLAAAFAIAPLVLYTYIKNFRQPSVKNAILAALASLVMASYEPRILYVEMIAIVLYALGYVINTPRVMSIRNYKNMLILALPFVLLILLSMFWLVGLYVTGGDQSQTVLSRSLFGDDFFMLVNAFTLSQPFWTGAAPESFVYHRIALNQWIIPLYGILGLYFNRKHKIALYLGLLVCLGILLGKQTSAPFTQLYPWLYGSIPGFNAFREGSKFYLLSALGYSGLVTLFITYIYDSKLRKTLKIGITLLPIVLLLFNLKPFMTGSIGSTTTPRHMPSAYAKWNDFISSQKQYSRVLWAPSDSRWADNTELHPNVTAVGSYQNGWKNLMPASLPATGAITTPIQNQITDLFKTPIINQVLNLSSIKYVVVPIRDTANDDDFFQNYSNDREFYLNVLASTPGLKKVNMNFDGLAVYENLNYTPYISTSQDAPVIPTLSKINQYNDFTNSTLGKNKNSFLSNTTNAPATTSAPQSFVSDAFDNLSASSVTSTGLAVKTNLNTNYQNSVYADVTTPSYSYQIAKNSLTFTKHIENVVAVNNTPIGSSSNTPTKKLQLDPSRSYAFSLGDKLLDIDTTNMTNRNIGTTTDAISLYSAAQNSNLIQNPSFESGAWQPTVDDCNHYDNNGDVSMDIVTQEKYDGAQALELGANLHTACTKTDAINVTAGQSYSLAYHYQISNGQRAGYALIFNDAKHTVLHADQLNAVDSWHHLQTSFVVPSGATSVQLQLKGYPDDTNQYFARTYYDAVAMQPLRLETAVAPTYTPSYQRLDLSDHTSVTLQTNDKAYSNANIIDNSSLENGLWQKNVGDCNNYDANPVLGMKLNTSIKTDGKQSLELSATRHIACTGPPAVPVSEGQDYQFSFDYQSPNSKQAGFYISFNDPDGSSFSKQLDIKSTGWQHYSGTVHVPYGATTLNLTVHSYADDSGVIKQINRYDNFVLTAVPNVVGRYYVVSRPATRLVAPKAIDFTSQSPSRKQIRISGATTGFYVNMSESYNKDWRLELDDAKLAGINGWLPGATPTSVTANNHFSADGFLNMWYVDPAVLCQQKSSACSRNADGSYNLTMVAEFTPQRSFYAGLIVSAITLAGCIGYLGYAYKRRRK